jgi:hypothetical protein
MLTEIESDFCIVMQVIFWEFRLADLNEDGRIVLRGNNYSQDSFLEV